MKRTFDICLAILLLVVLSPVFIGVGLLVWANLGSPILFKQPRPGYAGHPFMMLKFRTMHDACDATGKPLPDGKRLTPFGSFLRSTSLDELPELVNVLRGEMSFVGPRPLLMRYLPLYSERQARRHLVLPGITGWAQVNGRNALSWAEKFEYDAWYVDNRSFLLDLRILVLTAKKVLLRDGIAAEGEATAAEFKGNFNSEE